MSGGRVFFPALPARPLTRSPPRRVLPGPAQVRLKVLGSLGHPPHPTRVRKVLWATWRGGDEVYFGSFPEVKGEGSVPFLSHRLGVSVLTHAGCLLCGESDRGCVCVGRVGEPHASLGLIENHNMFKFSFVLCWGLGNMHSPSTFTVLCHCLPMGSVLCPLVLQKILF